jgi:hypothetical protein
VHFLKDDDFGGRFIFSAFLVGEEEVAGEDEPASSEDIRTVASS